MVPDKAVSGAWSLEALEIRTTTWKEVMAAADTVGSDFCSFEPSSSTR
jgi:hypothetical protein